MYKLYWAQETGAMAPQVILEEVGASYERVILDTDEGDELKPEYLAINPRGQVPALVLPDGTVLTETAATILHLGEVHPESGLIPPEGSIERAKLYRWLFYAASNIYESDLRLYYSDRYTSDIACAEAVSSAAREYMDKSWDIFESEMGDGPFLLGHQYSVIDPYLLMLAYWHETPETLFARCPRLARLCEAVRSRPAVERIWAQHYPKE